MKGRTDRDKTPRASHDRHDLTWGNWSEPTSTQDGNPGAAAAPERPCLLGPDGKPIRSRPDPPFGFAPS